MREVGGIMDTQQRFLDALKKLGSPERPIPSHDPQPEGLVEPGNLDIYRTPTVQTATGPATVRSKSWNFDGVEVLLPTVADGRELSDEEAIARYRQTGQHLGKFRTPQHATAYGDRLHQRYERGEIPFVGK